MLLILSIFLGTRQLPFIKINAQWEIDYTYRSTKIVIAQNTLWTGDFNDS